MKNYERIIRPLVESSRRIGPKLMGTIIPGSPLALRLMPFAAATLPKLPTPVQRFIWSQNAVGKALGSVDLLQSQVGQPIT